MEGQASRRNFWAFAGDGVLFTAGLAFFDATTVVPAFVHALTGSDLLVGLVGSAQALGLWLPSLIVANVVKHRAFKRPLVLLGGAITRLPVWVLAILILSFPAIDPASLAWLAVGGLVLFWIGDSIAGVPWLDMVGKGVPAARRSRFFGIMQGIGGLLAVGSGFIVRAILEQNTAPLPGPYGLIFLLGAILLTISYASFCLVREPPGQTAPRESLVHFLKTLGAYFGRQAAFARFMTAWVLIGWSALALPFYVVFGQSRLGFTGADVGLFLAAQTGGAALGGALWAWIGERRGHVRGIQGVGWSQAIAPLLGFGAAWAGPGAGAYVIFMLLFLCIGAGQAGWMPFIAYTLESVPAPERPVYLSLTNLIRAPMAIAPFAGGVIARSFGYEATFAAALACALCGVAVVAASARRLSGLAVS